MENLSHALYMAFAMFVFVLAFTYALYMLNNLNTTAETIVYRIDETNYYDSLSLDEWISDDDGDAYKIVGIDSIIPTLYRYYEESFTVRILDENGNLLQLFDNTVEGEVRTYANDPSTKLSNSVSALLSLYNDSDNASYLFGAPWVADLDFANKRIAMYISGAAGYINGVWVDYSVDYDTSKYELGSNLVEADKIYLYNFKNRQFKEIYSEYSYEGDTLVVETTDDGEAYETLTGTSQALTKIVITYQLISESE